mgnify:CR=1 FL=1
MKNSFKLFILAHKNNRGIHKKVVYTVIMILLFLLLIIPFSIFKTYDNELKRFENEDDSAKIISFYYDEKENYEKIKNKDFLYEDVLGDIIISIDKVREQAEEYGHSFERELSYMLVHGFYHLMGYDHIEEEDKKIMRPKEEKILNELKITRD